MSILVFMNYIVTDAGLSVLEETGLKKIVDENFKGLISEHQGFWYDDQQEEYSRTHRTHPNLTEDEQNDLIRADEKFLIFSFLYPNTLVEQGKISDKLNDNIMAAIGTYVQTKYHTEGMFKDKRTCRNPTFHTVIHPDVHGDFFLQQYNNQPDDSQRFLFSGCEPLIKRLKQKDIGMLYGHYNYWINFLESLVLYCCQTEQEVPFRHDFEKVFYNGKLPDEEPGIVARMPIEQLRDWTREANWKPCLPTLPDFQKQIDDGWMLEGQIENSQAFIRDGNLVFCDKDTNGSIEFEHNKWGNPCVTITPDMVREAVRATMELMIEGHAGRVMSHDPGLIMKHFPYHLFEKSENI